MNLNDQQKIRIGTSAWGFEDWQPGFYPREVPESHWLEFYARYFPAVEIDSTFYSPPAPEIARRWVKLTPPHFRFSCKLPRAITHACGLRDCNTELNKFFRAMEPLAAKLHVILIQLPPAFSPEDGKTALRSFLRQLPKTFRYAIEFRHGGWHRPQIIGLLEKYRIAWVWADTSPLDERNLAPFEFLPRTADFLYLRLLGDYSTKYNQDGKHLHSYGKLLWKREAALDSWAIRIERHLPEVRSVWAFAGNHFEGFAPETCQRLAQRLGFDLPLVGAGADTAAETPGAQLELL
ncbi:MAG: DUF72 domain-containing protein [Chthoniobacterales bacterium]